MLELTLDRSLISLGQTKLIKTPWELVENHFPFNTVITAVKSKIKSQFIFGQVEEEFERSVQRTEISYSYTSSTRQSSTMRQEVHAHVIPRKKYHLRNRLAVKQLGKES